jgi:Cu+-exporting ATPase
VGDELSEVAMAAIRARTEEAAHPLRRYVHQEISADKLTGSGALSEFREYPGKGILANFSGSQVQLGSEKFLGLEKKASQDLSSKVLYGIDGNVKGYFLVDKNYHQGLSELISDLKKKFKLFLISGDSDGERKRMESLFGQKTGIYFQKLPHQKAEIVKELKQSGKTAMIGDGLNDAAALKASDFGISVADDIFRFTPASDAIMSSENFSELNKLFDFSKASLRVVKWSFVFSFLYNGVGLFVAVQGLLTPVIAAILMPLSSVTVVLFVSLGTQFQFNKLFKTSHLAKTDKNQVLK